METNINRHILYKGNEVYIYTISIIGNNILRMTCYLFSNQNKIFFRDFTIENLTQIDEIFSSFKSVNEASYYIDKILNNQKVSVIEENGTLKIKFYITKNGINKQIDIPLNDYYNPGFFGNRQNQFLQEGNFPYFEFNPIYNNPLVIGPIDKQNDPSFEKYNGQNPPIIDNNIDSTFLPIQTPSIFLPPLGPSTSLQGLNLHEQEIKNGKPNSNNKSNNIISKTIEKNVETKEQIKNNESEEIKILKARIAELEPLKKKVAEMEVLRGRQLTELKALRAQVAEYEAFKEQFKSVHSQLEKLEFENQQLKIKTEELENIIIKYEEEIKVLKQKEKIYNKINKIEEKEEIYEENSQDITLTGDIIHNGSELDLLTKKINKLNQKLTLNLLYKATADSDKAEAFHAKCDDACSSIVLVETDKGKRFGGYTTCSWAGDCIDKIDEEAFIFSLDKMKTYDNIPGESSIGCYPKFGPIFLGYQIRIYDNFFTKGGTTFERGLNYDTKKDYELTGGERVFNVKEIEVYEVIKE